MLEYLSSFKSLRHIDVVDTLIRLCKCLSHLQAPPWANPMMKGFLVCFDLKNGGFVGLLKGWSIPYKRVGSPCAPLESLSP